MAIRALIAIIIVAAVVLLAIAIAMGALGPVEELVSKQRISEILNIFGIKGGVK